MLINNILSYVLTPVYVFMAGLILNWYLSVQLQVQSPGLLRALPEWWKRSDNL